jgi:hypothetical protein
MIATIRVKDDEDKTIGFIINNKFYNNYVVKKNIEQIENLKILKNGVIRSRKELPTATYKEAVNEYEYNRLIKYNPFIRDVQSDLLLWKRSFEHSVLQLEGPRQVGKTTELLKFAYTNYDLVIYISLVEKLNQVLDIIRGDETVAQFQRYCLENSLPCFVNDSSTVIIIDEVQISKEVYSSIRKLRSNLDCDIIVTGSYLGQTIRDNCFFPAGIQIVQMCQLSFKEFCRVFKQEDLLNEISIFGESKDEDYSKLYKLYDLYRDIGGYPEVVKAYIRTKSIDTCYIVIANLLEVFKMESRAYFQNSREPLIFEAVYDEAIKEICDEKRGTGNKLAEKVTKLAKESTKMLVSTDEVSGAISWLVYSGILGDCGMYVNGNSKQWAPSRRLYYTDCGIASFVGKRSDIDTSSIEGLITETFAYTELRRIFMNNRTSVNSKRDKPCFSTYNNYELDFMIKDKNNKVYGIEVKTKTGNPKSLKVYISKHLVDRGIVAKRTKGGHGGYFDSIPIFAVGARFPYN